MKTTLETHAKNLMAVSGLPYLIPTTGRPLSKFGFLSFIQKHMNRLIDKLVG